MGRGAWPGRKPAGVALAALLTVSVLSGCSPANGSPTATGSLRRPSDPGGRDRSTTTTVRGAAVTMDRVPLVDASRPVVSHGEVVAGRRELPTTVWSPTGPGPFPLVVFVHGYDKGPLDYRRFCSTLAAAGYVVAAPSFPLEDPGSGLPLDEAHLSDEAADVSFVIGAIEGDGDARVDRARIAVAGHSDGADVALLVGYGTGSVDPRIGAVVADAPDPMTAVPVTSHVPLLLVQGTADEVVPYAQSQTVYDQVVAPVSYLSLVGADHLGPIAGGTPWTPVMDDAVARFLDATVAGYGPGRKSLAGVLSADPLVRFETKG